MLSSFVGIGEVVVFGTDNSFGFGIESKSATSGHF